METKNYKICFMFVSAIFLFMETYAGIKPINDSQRKRIYELVKVQQPYLSEDALAIWDIAELGFLETKSSLILQNRLGNSGFTVNSGVAGMPTAFIASYKNGDGPVIAILSEFDALPGLSQDTTSERKIIPGKNTGHGCGHNLIGAASTASAIALKQWLQESGTNGEIRLYGCPAEEGGGAKVYLTREGLFNDVDVVIHWHPSDCNSYYTSPHMAILTGKFTFHGLSSHASASPDRGRSALDGVQLMSMAIEFLREHIPDKTRIHYIISSGGEATNVVPDYASMYLTVRHNDTKVVKEVWERVLDASKGAAIATGTTSGYEIINGMYPLLINRTLIDVAVRNFEAVQIPSWNEEQKVFANNIADTLSEVGELNPAIILPPYPAKEVNASTDVGDVSWVVPTVGIFTMCWIPGTPAHSWQAVAASGSSLGVQGAFVASEVIATTAAELFLNPEIIENANKEMLENRGKEFKYEPMLGDREPALDYRIQVNI
jgi:aminobenzoyl-glutamate utilization protein B